jgi:tRNA modification GTPase
MFRSWCSAASRSRTWPLRQRIEMAPEPSTFVVELTPAGRAAVAVVLVAGSDAVQFVDQCCSLVSRRPVAIASLDRILLSRWREPGGEELIVCRRSSNSVEVHCHGGTAAVRAVIEQLCKLGCRPLTWQDWLNTSSADPIRAAAQIALSHAPTARTAAIILDQYHGSLAAAVRQVLDADDTGDCVAACDALQAVLAGGRVGLHLTTPWQVVIAGPPNVGKSSLMNALVGYDRAIVCDLPGTTRDVVGATTAIDGWPVRFSDTAGLRDAGDHLEQAGIERAASAIAAADLALLVHDATRDADRGNLDGSWSAANIASYLPPSTPLLRVLNKVDLLPSGVAPSSEGDDLCTSALTGQGIESLIAAISRTLVPTPPPPCAAVPFTADQIKRLEFACDAAQRGDRAAIVASLQPLISSK